MGLPNEVNSALIGAAAAGGVYEIEQSLRFNNPTDGHYLNRTPSTASNRRTFTYSGWHKFVGMPDALNKRRIFSARSDNSDTGWFAFLMNPTDDNRLEVQLWNHSVQADARIRDFSAWYHIVLAVDTTQATATDRVKLYLNGVRASMSTRSGSGFAGFTQNLQTAVNNTTAIHNIGTQANDTNTPAMPMYAAEIHFVDGTALDQYDFGEFDDNNVWRPINVSGLTYGTNGYYLNFSNSSDLGEDQAGSNDWTANNFTTSGTGTDVMSDTPTTNWATFNPLVPGASSFSNGNLTVTANNSGNQNRGTPFPTIKLPDSGKWYAEFTPSSIGEIQIGLVQGKSATGAVGDTVAGYYRLGNISVEGSGTVETVASFTNGDVIGVIVNADDQEIRFSKNGTIVTTQAWDYSSAPNSSNCYLSFKQGSSSGSCTAAANYGAQGFAHTPPTGYKALNTANLPAPDIADGSEYFDIVLWTGNQTARTISMNSTFTPDFIWIKNRTSGYNHSLQDIVRGFGPSTKLNSNTTTPENSANTEPQAGYVDSAAAGSFDIDASATATWYHNNLNSNAYVGWCWDAGGSGSSNTDGSINSTVSANPTAGFSIVSYTGVAGDDISATIGHGLGVAADFIIIKNRDWASSAAAWVVYHSALPSTGSSPVRLSQTLALDETQAASGNDFKDLMNNTLPTSTVFSVSSSTGISAANRYRTYGRADDYIAYCFAEVEGYSKFGIYNGNGPGTGTYYDGPFIYTGFTPKYFLYKTSSNTAQWQVVDSTRGGDSGTANPISYYLVPDDASGEVPAASNNYGIDFCSNGIKIRNGNVYVNYSGWTYIYAAFAENPFGGSGVSPAAAR